MMEHIEETYISESTVGDQKSSLEFQMYENDHKRKENFKNHFSRILIVFLYLASIIVASMIICWSYHFLAPEHLYFLSNERFREIQSMLFAGLVSQAIPYISHYLKKQE
jgi:uncharacterized membrane protein SpoIIM required for sporulation